jgi:tRNA threonylcarbamoyl adenosine modification protein YeaZ
MDDLRRPGAEDVNTLLALDTSQPVPQMALWRAGQWTYILDAQGQQSHTVLFKALQHSGLNPASLTDVLVCVGPGSYTGLRSGISMVTCWQRNLPGIRIWPVTRFQLVTDTPQEAWVMLPALRQVAYVARLNSQHQITLPQSVDASQWHPPDNAPVVAHPAMAGYYPGVTPLSACINPLHQALALWQQGRLQPVPGPLTPLYIHPPKITPPKKLMAS